MKNPHFQEIIIIIIIAFSKHPHVQRMFVYLDPKGGPGGLEEKVEEEPSAKGWKDIHSLLHIRALFRVVKKSSYGHRQTYCKPSKCIIF